jgi:exodeoxyribonuclease VIII
VHLAILEPHLVEQNMICGLDVDRRSNANKEAWANFEREHAGKIILKADDYDHVMRMRDAVHSHPIAAGLFTGGHSEQSVFARDIGTGQLIKCRTDYMHNNFNTVVDLKKTVDASLDGFKKSATNYRYDVQMAWYYHVLYCAFGYYPETWAFVAIEEEPPYAIGIYFMNEHMPEYQRAMNAAMRDFDRIVSHTRENFWPDYGYAPQALEISNWAKR